MAKTSPAPIDMDPCSHEKTTTCWCPGAMSWFITRINHLHIHAYIYIYSIYAYISYIYIYAYISYIYILCMIYIYIYSFNSYAYHFSLVIGRMSYQRWPKGHHLQRRANRQELLHQHPTKRGSSTCLVNVTRGVGTYSLLGGSSHLVSGL